MIGLCRNKTYSAMEKYNDRNDDRDNDGNEDGNDDENGCWFIYLVLCITALISLMWLYLIIHINLPLAWRFVSYWGKVGGYLGRQIPAYLVIGPLILYLLSIISSTRL